MSSSRKQRSRNDTWRADALEQSIKEALADSTERKHRSKERRLKKKEKEDRESVKKDKSSSQLTHDDITAEKARTPHAEGRDHAKHVDIHERTEIKGKQTSKQEQNEITSLHFEVTKDTEQEDSSACVLEDNDVYEDDFEECEDDWEDSGHDESKDKKRASEMVALQMAIKEENDATLGNRKEMISTTSKLDASTRRGTNKSRQAFINFTAAKQRQMNLKVAQRTMQRGRELMNLIELDVSSCNMFEMPPVKVYDLYIKSYGRSNTKQAFVQCHDDIMDKDIQTEPIETRQISIQHPSEGISTVNANQEPSDNREEVTHIKLDSLRLSRFLEKAGQVMNTILEENLSGISKCGLQSNQRSILFSEGYTQLSCDLPFLKGKCVTHAQFHPVQTNLLLTVYSKSHVNHMVEESNLSHQDFLCVWNVSNSLYPYRIMTCKSEVKCCCFSPIKSTFIFAGTVDGSILVWDLREPGSMHKSYQYNEEKITLRVPTFSTSGVHSEDNHYSAVAKLQPIMTTDDTFKGVMQDTDSSKRTGEICGLSFQLASLDEQGTVHFWVVIDMNWTDIAGSETDFGLVPNGKVKLLKSSSIVLENLSRNMVHGFQAKDMKFALKNPNEFYVATDLGCILHGSRHGGRVSPRCYKTQNDIPATLTRLDLSPFGLPCLLAASSDGCIYLYSLSFESPLLTWNNSTGCMPIVSLLWSRSRPSVFYVMDVTSKVYVWELLVNQGGPVKTEQFTSGRLRSVELSNDHTATGKGLQGKAAAMVITDDKGAVDVHVLNQHFSVATTNELEQMTEFLNAFK